MKPLAALLLLWSGTAGAMSDSTRVVAGLVSMVAVPVLMFTVRDHYGDKAAHCFVGAGASLGVGLLSSKPSHGWVASVVLGVGKEAFDHERGFAFDGNDVAATVACGSVPYFAMERLL